MLPEPKLEILLPNRRRRDTAIFDAFHENRVREDLAEFSETSGLIEQYMYRASIRLRKAGERAILEQYERLYQAGERLIAARVAMERRKSEYLQLTREHEIKEMGKATELAKLRADGEDHDLRREKAAHQRQNVSRYADGELPGLAEDEQKLRQACERRQLDARWELHESLRPLQSLIELQRWRRQQRDGILKDRSLSPEEQSEDLRFVDDLYKQKHEALRVDTRIFEDQ
jgi:hypothetical protein